MNRFLLAATLVSAFAAATAQAAETGKLNQAGVYEQTMRFYLHPAHGFSRDLYNNGDHPAVIVFRRDTTGAEPAVVTIHTHPAIEPRGAQSILASHL